MSETQEPRPAAEGQAPSSPASPCRGSGRPSPSPRRIPRSPLEELDKKKGAKSQGRRRIRIQVVEQVQGEPVEKPAKPKPAKPKPAKKKAERGGERREAGAPGGDAHVRHDRVAAAGPPDHGRPDGLLRLHRGLERVSHALRRLRRVPTPIEAVDMPMEAPAMLPGPAPSREPEAHYMLDRARDYAKRGQTKDAIAHAQAGRRRSTRGPGRPARPRRPWTAPSRTSPCSRTVPSSWPSRSRPTPSASPASANPPPSAAGPGSTAVEPAHEPRDRHRRAASGRHGRAATR